MQFPTLLKIGQWLPITFRIQAKLQRMGLNLSSNLH